MSTKPKRARLNAPFANVPVVQATAVYDLGTAASILRTSKRRLGGLVNSGTIVGRKEGTRILILGESILEYLRRPLTPSESNGIASA